MINCTPRQVTRRAIVAFSTIPNLTLGNYGAYETSSFLMLLPGEGPDHVGEKFLHDTHGDIGAHGDAKTHGAIPGGCLTLWKPSPGQECSCRHAAHLGE